MYKKKPAIFTVILTVFIVFGILNYNKVISNKYFDFTKAKITAYYGGVKAAFRNSKDNLISWNISKTVDNSNNYNEIKKTNTDNKNKININDSYKEEILKYADTLSVLDYKRIENYLDTSMLDDVLDSQNLLKKRLSKDDYNKISKIYEAIYKNNNISANY